MGAGGGVVPIDRDGFIQARDDQLGISIAIEIAGGGRVAHAKMCESPLFREVVELQVAAVYEGQVLLLARGL